MARIPRLLSKTKLLRGFRCLKSIYLTIHEPAREAPITPDIQALFDQGNQVGAKAREYFSGGILVDNVPQDFLGAITKTQFLIEKGHTVIFEAAFSYLGFYARADVIAFNPETKRWSLYEVKSTTKVKPEHINDVAIQAWILTKSGLALEKVYLMHLNSACRHPDLSNLFIKQEITDDVRLAYTNVKPTLREILKNLNEKTTPDINIGPQCHAGTACGFVEHCFKEKAIPTPSIFNLPGLRERKWALYEQDIVTLDDARLSDLNELQQRIINCFKSQSRFINANGIRDALVNFQYPMIFLDFETINPAIPRFDGCGPFHHVPFQFSVHRMDEENGSLKQVSFLHTEKTDPRPTLIPALLSACRDAKAIVSYYGKFEADRIKELAEFSPAHADELQSLIHRIVDPLPIIKENVYDNEFLGSFSLKVVAPALLGKKHSYDDLMVANGGDAQRAYESLISNSVSQEQKEKIKRAMLAYCEQDTFVMVELVNWLKAATGEN